MNRFKTYKECGLTQEAERSFNMTRGCILASGLEKESKRNLLEFIAECESYFEEEEE